MKVREIITITKTCLYHVPHDGGQAGGLTEEEIKIVEGENDLK